MNLRHIPFAFALSAAFAAAAMAADKPAPAKVPEPPPMPARESSVQPPAEPAEGVPEPEITITTRGAETHEEYRFNGRLFKIKVTPAHGKPYYLIDYEGSGVFRRSELEPATSIPMWVIKSW